METKTINAMTNPDLANRLAAEAVADETTTKPAEITPPSEVIVALPGGYVTSAGEVLRTAEVRELNGRDEEAVSKSSTLARAMATILSRGTVKIGDQPATEQVLDGVLAADRDAIMLGIYRATFGDTADMAAYCQGCKDFKTVQVNVNEDIKTKVLMDPIEDRQFTVQGRNAEYTVRLPEGKAQREVAAQSDKTVAELDTLLLEYCVYRINGRQVFNKAEVQNIGLSDRRKLLEAILERNPGPQFENLTVSCPDCSGEVVVPINLGTLFRL